ncbi:hypothetical protein A2U01_0036105, partial [Trifolium medium]|nr:hypothetical protein [Trifolium medium]
VVNKKAVVDKKRRRDGEVRHDGVMVCGEEWRKEITIVPDGEWRQEEDVVNEDGTT